MDWTPIVLELLIIALLFAMLARSHFKSEEVHERLDDVIEGIGIFATEMLKKTENLADFAGKISPAIELHNHNPLEQIFSFIRGMKTGNFDGFGSEMNNNPRDPSGRYAAPPEETEDTSPQVIDITN
jgi:hypothetical protein